MKEQTPRLLAAILGLVVIAITLSACDRANVLSATSFKYGYDGKFGLYDIADTAEAYNGNVLIGKAHAIELQQSETGGPKNVKIEVTHCSATGEPVYRGYVYIQAGFGGGRLIREEDISGHRQTTVFGSWQFGH